MGTSLAVQWLRFRAFNQGVQVWSLVGELRSHMPSRLPKKGGGIKRISGGGYLPKENKNTKLKRYRHPYVHCKCISVDEWMKKVWYIYTIEYYSAIGKNEILSLQQQEQTQRVLLNESRQRKMNTICFNLSIGFKKMKQSKNRNKFIDTQNWWLLEKEEGGELGKIGERD